MIPALKTEVMQQPGKKYQQLPVAGREKEHSALKLNKEHRPSDILILDK
jgi:hypothetical protein